MRKIFKYSIFAILVSILSACTMEENNRDNKISTIEQLSTLEIPELKVEDLPKSLQENEEVTPALNPMALVSRADFKNEENVRGDSYQRLMDIVNDKTVLENAIVQYERVVNIVEGLELEDGVVKELEDGTQVYLKETDQYTEMALQTKNIIRSDVDIITTVDIKRTWNDDQDEYNYEVSIVTETISEEDNDENRLVVQFNESQNVIKHYTKKVRGNEKNYSTYFSLDSQDEVTKIISKKVGIKDEFEVVAYASDDFAVVLSTMEMNSLGNDFANGKKISKEFYNSDGALVKQEFGTANLSKITRFFPNKNRLQVTATNMSDIIPDEIVDNFSVIYYFDGTAEILHQDNTYEITEDTLGLKKFLFYSIEGEEWDSGDKIYGFESKEILETGFKINYSTLAEVPTLEKAINEEEYYMSDYYVSKFIEPIEGYEIYNNNESYYIEKEYDPVDTIKYPVPIKKTEHKEFYKGFGRQADNISLLTMTKPISSDAKFEFTEQDLVDSATVKVEELYQTDMISTEKLNILLENAKAQMFEQQQVFNEQLESSLS